MGNGIPIQIIAWKCIECQKVYLSRIASDLCCDAVHAVDDASRDLSEVKE